MIYKIVFLTSPIKQRIIEVDVDPLLVALIHQFLHDVALERGRLNDVEVRVAAIEHREAVMMTGREADVFGSRRLECRYPLGGVEVGRIEASGQFGILLVIEVTVVHHSFAIGHHAIDAIVEEDAEFIVLELLSSLQVLGCRLIALLSHNGKAQSSGQQ